MKTKLAVVIILAIFAVILFMPPLVNKLNAVDVSITNPDINASPAKPELQEELQVAGAAGSNAGQVADEILVGYKFAQQQTITSHANCIVIDDPAKKNGCHRYVNDQHQVPPYVNYADPIDNMSSNQCRVDTNAYYETVDKDMRQQAMAESILGQLKTDWRAQLDTCSKYPYKALGVTELQPMILNIEKTGDVRQQDVRAVLFDVAEKRTFADVAARAEYVKSIEHIFSGEAPTTVDSAACELNKQQLDVLSELLVGVNEFKKANLELWSSVELQRKILLWKKLLLIDQAHNAGCVITTEQ